MDLGQNLAHICRKNGYSQEFIAEKLGVSRQTISKWELDETLPDIRQSKKLASLYHITLDELITYDSDIAELKDIIVNTNDKIIDKIDWNKTWGNKYPILLQYQNQVELDYYAKNIQAMLNELIETYNFSSLDAMLVLKDILVKTWKSAQKN